MTRILLIEDEKNISTSLSIILEDEGFRVSIAETGKEGLEKFSEYDLVVLDLMLPDMSGLEILRAIRQHSSTYPVLIVSAKASESDVVTGLELGADDYITKPFSIKALILRIKRTLERKHLYEKQVDENINGDVFTFANDFTIDFKNMTATTNGGEISLTSQEASILLYLIEHEGKVINRKDLINHIWGHDRDIETRTIDNFIVRFRKYFESDAKKPNFFLTKRGVGYMFLSK